jgi:formamidopyrimidine-DNA glycosylase
VPELPEVETMVRGIRPHVVGRKILKLRRCPTPCRPISLTPRFSTMAKRAAGQTITTVRRLAKRVVMDLSDGSTMAIEPRMTGLMLINDPPDQKHLRLEWQLAGSGTSSSSLWFWDQRGLGTVTHYQPGEFAAFEQSGKLGPDALVATLEQWQHWTSRTDRAIKVALLDQKCIAGIGNLYASEILFLAGIHPARPCRSLTTADIVALRERTLEVLEIAIRYEGSTLSDGTYRNVLNQDGSYQNEHRVYDLEGATCTTCGDTPIVRIVQAQRSTFFCPICQPQRRRRRKRE